MKEENNGTINTFSKQNLASGIMTGSEFFRQNIVRTFEHLQGLMSSVFGEYKAVMTIEWLTSV